MRLKKRVGTQIILSLGFMFLLTLLLGITTFVQTNRLSQQTDSLYNHPFQVRMAIDGVNKDILMMQLGMSELLLAPTKQESQAILQRMRVADVDIENRFATVKSQYLGPTDDVDKAYLSYVNWNVLHDEAIRLILAGKIDEVKLMLLPSGSEGKNRANMLADIKEIDDYAKTKAEEFHQSSIVLSSNLNLQLIYILLFILVSTTIIGYFLFVYVRNPLKSINDAVLKFQQGDMDARSDYTRINEFGTLSASINLLADNVQNNVLLSQKSARLAETMLREEDMQKFFAATLQALIDNTGAQMGAVYLLNDDMDTYELYESIGTTTDVNPSFSAISPEGEFSAAIRSKQLQLITQLPDGTRFIFQTVNGHFVPKEIITIPISVNSNVNAVISLASIKNFNPHSIDLLNSNLVVISARIEGILSYRKIKEFKEALEQQNAELESQKHELLTQSSELAQQNSELETQKNQLVEASRLKTNFLSNMSHELRTPLNSVIALSGVLSRRLESQIPSEEFSFIEVIERNGKNLLLLINDILDISRIESGHEEIEISHFNMNALVEEIITIIKPQADQNNISIIHETNGLDLYLRSDLDKCHHVLQNLIGNAVKFTEHGNVNICATTNKDQIEVKVSDTGIGISADHLPYIFDEFRQADGSTSRRFGGSGLGLAIAKKYANILGGTITVKSTMNEGSEFTLILPLTYDALNRIPDNDNSFVMNTPLKQGAIHTIQESKLKTVLIVEDNESAIIQIKSLVEEIGVRVLVAHNALEAFNIIDNIIPDAMILDLMMPEIDGFSVLQTMRDAEATALVPVLILTAKHITKDDLKNLKRNNIHQLIQKGDVDRLKLQQAVTSMIYPEKTGTIEPQRTLQDIPGKPLVLVVEDNPDNMITVRAMLAGNYTVLEAVDGNEGIEMARLHIPHLILMDIALPGINGIEAFQRIRSIPTLSHIPVIALTASAMEKDREAILSHGFDAYIAKPIIAKEFFKVINEVLYGK